MMMYEAMSTFERDISKAPPVAELAHQVRGAARFALLPELAPADPEEAYDEDTAADHAMLSFTSASIVDESTDFRERIETESTVARLTVYTLNATIMVFAFPIGFGLLMFNILGGENLRTTAHAMALTGLALALGMNDYGMSAIPGI
jgi:hypothetical protein